MVVVFPRVETPVSFGTAGPEALLIPSPPSWKIALDRITADEPVATETPAVVLKAMVLPRFVGDLASRAPMKSPEAPLVIRTPVPATAPVSGEAPLAWVPIR